MTEAAGVRFSRVESRDNALVKRLRALSRPGAAYRKHGVFWIEGEHLCSAAVARGVDLEVAVFAESFWPQTDAGWAHQARTLARKCVVMPDALIAELSGLESAARIGFLIDLPALSVPRPGVASVVLDRVQDAGNVGSILRSACAFGFGQVLALRGTAGLWSSKVLRAAMGAHFGLQLIEGLQPSDISALGLPLIVTSSHQGQWLQQQNLPWPCAWAFGHEGQGLCDELLRAAERGVRIAQPGGEESLNVAAAAAICLHASAIAQARERGPR